MSFHWQSTIQQLHFILGNQNTRLPPVHPGHPLNTAVEEILFEPKSDPCPSTQKPYSDSSPAQSKGCSPCPHELKGPWSMSSVPSRTSLMPHRSLSGSLPGHTATLLLLQHSRTCQLTQPWDLLLSLPSPLCPHLPQRWFNTLLPQCALATMATHLSGTQSLTPSSAYSLSSPLLII